MPKYEGIWKKPSQISTIDQATGGFPSQSSRDSGSVSMSRHVHRMSMILAARGRGDVFDTLIWITSYWPCPNAMNHVPGTTVGTCLF